MSVCVWDRLVLIASSCEFCLCVLASWAVCVLIFLHSFLIIGCNDDLAFLIRIDSEWKKCFRRINNDLYDMPYTLKRPSAKGALKLGWKATSNDRISLSRVNWLSVNYWGYNALQSSVYCSNYSLLSLHMANDTKWLVNFIVLLKRCQIYVKWSAASCCVGELACRLKDNSFFCV